MGYIKFGTDGWRDRIAENFTFENLGRVADAFAVYALAVSKAAKVAVGYDMRFMSEKYAQFVAERLSKYGITAYLFDAAVTTPLVSFAVKQKKMTAGIMITSSHNPWNYNGLKIKNSFGAGLSKAEVKKVEEMANKGARPAEKEGKLISFNFDEEYISEIKKLVDIEAIKKSGMKIVVDAMCGPGGKYFEKLFEGYKKIEIINNRRDPMFGGVNPEPIEQNLKALIKAVKENKADAGVAVDGDGDRMGVIDNKGIYLSAHKAYVFLIMHHLKNKKFKGAIIRTVSGTQLIDKICKEAGIPVVETPIGFNNIAEIMIADSNTIGGEESGGIGFGYYLPERDGIVSNLLLLEFSALEKKKLRRLLHKTDKKYGFYRYGRIDVKFSEAERSFILNNLEETVMKGIAAGKKIKATNIIDGTKMIFSKNEWLLLRFSGTEPLLRIYAEAPTDARVKALLAFGKKLAQ